MSIYGIDVLGKRIGYVCTENKDEATIKAANVFGFNDLSEYVSVYPGCYFKESKIRNLITNVPKHNYFKETLYALKNPSFLILPVDSRGQWCVCDLIQCAKAIDEHCFWDSGWYERTVIVPKIAELKQGDPEYFSDDRWDACMWYCEDWTENENI